MIQIYLFSKKSREIICFIFQWKIIKDYFFSRLIIFHFTGAASKHRNCKNIKMGNRWRLIISSKIVSGIVSWNNTTFFFLFDSTIVYRKRRSQWLEPRISSKATLILPMTLTPQLCLHMPCLCSAAFMLRWLCVASTTWPSLKVLLPLSLIKAYYPGPHVYELVSVFWEKKK